MLTTRFIAYYRVSTERQRASGLGLEAQTAAVAQIARTGQLLAYEDRAGDQEVVLTGAAAVDDAARLVAEVRGLLPGQHPEGPTSSTRPPDEGRRCKREDYLRVRAQGPINTQARCPPGRRAPLQAETAAFL